jgi:hypothetical protein
MGLDAGCGIVVISHPWRALWLWCVVINHDFIIGSSGALAPFVN